MKEMSSISKEDVVKFIENMTVLELSELVKELEERFGVSAAAPVAIAAMPGVAAEAAPVEEQTEFSVVITGVGDKKIQVIKEVRAITSLGLKEAKDLVEKLPGLVKEAIPKAEAEAVAKQLTEAGATVEIK
jgi:large subunit ribosomal protein L7/L12